VVCILVLFAVAVTAQNTFCERYTGALFGQYNNATFQEQLVDLVVTRAFTGVAAGPGALIAVTGLYYAPWTSVYFNGSSFPFINYLLPASASALATLVDHLNRFFMMALGCRAGAAAFPWTAVSLNSIHAQMGINAVTETQFITQVAYSMISYGVPAPSSPMLPTDDINYVASLMSQFNRYTGANAASVCIDVTCPYAHGFGEIDTSAAGIFSVIIGTGTGTTTLTVYAGDYVHWNLGAADNLIQSATAGGTTPMTGGIVSGTGFGSYIWQATVSGNYWFYNNRTMSTCTVKVIAAPAGSSSAVTSSSSMMSTSMTMMSSGMTMMSSGMTMMSTAASSTGVSAASTVEASVGVLLALAVAVTAIMS